MKPIRQNFDIEIILLIFNIIYEHEISNLSKCLFKIYSSLERECA